VTLDAAAAARAAADVVGRLIEQGRLVRDGDSVGLPGLRRVAEVDVAVSEAMERLERALDVPAPPSLAEAARVAGCPPSVIRDLERAGRLVLLEPDLAYASTIYRDLATRALALASTAPLTPAPADAT
jgi:hypothetical protein